MKSASYIPEGLHVITPMLAIHDASKSIDWYKTIFGASEKMRLVDPEGNIVHAELKIGDSIVMIAEENKDYNKSPETLHGTSVILNVYVSDVDKTVEKALASGARMIFPVNDQFYGDRAGRIEDPFGHMWIVSTHIKNVSSKKMQKEVDEMKQN